MNTPRPLGMRHVALRVRDAQLSKNFYTELFAMDVEWEPDPHSVYLSTDSQDNLALHQHDDLTAPEAGHSLDHIGFFYGSKAEVDVVYQKAQVMGVPLHQDLKQHRDGAYSFYLKDPDGVVVQVLFHPPVAIRYGFHRSGSGEQKS